MTEEIMNDELGNPWQNVAEDLAVASPAALSVLEKQYVSRRMGERQQTKLCGGSINA